MSVLSAQLYLRVNGELPFYFILFETEVTLSKQSLKKKEDKKKREKESNKPSVKVDYE